MKINLKRKTGVILQGLIFTGVWFSLTGFAHSFSLPFSKTDYFDFNPEPTFAAVFATIVYPIVMAFILISSSKGNLRKIWLSKYNWSILHFNYDLVCFVAKSCLSGCHVPFYLLNLDSVCFSRCNNKQIKNKEISLHCRCNNRF